MGSVGGWKKFPSKWASITSPSNWLYVYWSNTCIGYFYQFTKFKINELLELHKLKGECSYNVTRPHTYTHKGLNSNTLALVHTTSFPLFDK